MAEMTIWGVHGIDKIDFNTFKGWLLEAADAIHEDPGWFRYAEQRQRYLEEISFHKETIQRAESLRQITIRTEGTLTEFCGVLIFRECYTAIDRDYHEIRDSWAELFEKVFNDHNEIRLEALTTVSG